MIPLCPSIVRPALLHPSQFKNKPSFWGPGWRKEEERGGDIDRTGRSVKGKLRERELFL